MFQKVDLVAAGGRACSLIDARVKVPEKPLNSN